mgnify:FL=1
MREAPVQYWYNVTRGCVETDETRGQGEDVLGPFATQEEAQKALDTAKARTEKWDDEDREWNERGASPQWKAADDS